MKLTFIVSRREDMAFGGRPLGVSGPDMGATGLS